MPKWMKKSSPMRVEFRRASRKRRLQTAIDKSLGRHASMGIGERCPDCATEITRYDTPEGVWIMCPVCKWRVKAL